MSGTPFNEVVTLTVVEKESTVRDGGAPCMPTYEALLFSKVISEANIGYDVIIGQYFGLDFKYTPGCIEVHNTSDDFKLDFEFHDYHKSLIRRYSSDVQSRFMEYTRGEKKEWLTIVAIFNAESENITVKVFVYQTLKST